MKLYITPPTLVFRRRPTRSASRFPMLVATTGAAIVFVVTLLFSPETRGKELVPKLTLVESAA